MIVELVTNPDIERLASLAIKTVPFIFLGSILMLFAMAGRKGWAVLLVLGAAILITSIVIGTVTASKRDNLEHQEFAANRASIEEAYGVTVEHAEEVESCLIGTCTGSQLASVGKKAVYITYEGEKESLLHGVLQVKEDDEGHATEAKLFVEENRNMVPAEEFDFANNSNLLVP